MNAWNWWAIYISADALESADTPKIRENPALIQPDASFGESYMFKRGYALGNWSKFVRPGFQRIAATDRPTGGVLIEAYRDATHLAVIAVNTSSKPVTQKFILDGATFGTLTPWVTSPDDNLAAKDPFTAYDTFTYDLPASSVVTFVNWDATTETPGQGTLPGDVDGGTDVRISTGLDCPNALVPNNGVNGGVTDFTDWKGGSGRWGDQLGLWGNIYAYQGPNGSTMSAAVENQTLARRRAPSRRTITGAPASASRSARRSRRSPTSSSRCPGPHPDATWSCRSRRSISSPSSRRHREAATRTSKVATTFPSRSRSRCPRRSRR